MNRGWVIGLVGAVIILAAVGMTAWGHYLVETYWPYTGGFCGTGPPFEIPFEEVRALYHRGEVLETVGPWLLGAGCVVMAIGLWTVWRPVVVEGRSKTM